MCGKIPNNGSPNNQTNKHKNRHKLAHNSQSEPHRLHRFRVVHVQSLHFPGHSAKNGGLRLFVHGRVAMTPECSHQQRRRLSSKGHLAVCPTFIPADHAPPLQPRTRTHMVTPTGMGSPGSGLYLEITSGCSFGPHGCTQHLRFPVPRHFHICCPLYFFHFIVIKQFAKELQKLIHVLHPSKITQNLWLTAMLCVAYDLDVEHSWECKFILRWPILVVKGGLHIAVNYIFSFVCPPLLVSPHCHNRC